MTLDTQYVYMYHTFPTVYLLNGKLNQILNIHRIKQVTDSFLNFSVCVPHVPTCGLHPDGCDHHETETVLDTTSLSANITPGL